MHKANMSNKKKNLRKKASKDQERENPELEGKRNGRIRERKLLGHRRGFGCR